MPDCRTLSEAGHARRKGQTLHAAASGMAPVIWHQEIQKGLVAAISKKYMAWSALNVLNTSGHAPSGLVDAMVGLVCLAAVV